MAKLTTEEFIAAIKELSVLELNELVKACEEDKQFKLLYEDDLPVKDKIDILAKEIIDFLKKY